MLLLAIILFIGIFTSGVFIRDAYRLFFTLNLDMLPRWLDISIKIILFTITLLVILVGAAAFSIVSLCVMTPAKVK